MSERLTYSTSTDDFIRAVAVSIVKKQKYHLNVLLFLLTILSTLFWGAYMMLLHEAHGQAVDPLQFFRQVTSEPALLYKGIGYCFTIMVILLSHEMGHYLACLYYGIHATLPFFLPAPIVLTGTFGAFIRIRSPFPNRRSLFDVGIAGPLAGFIVMLPFLYFGIRWSIVPLSQAPQNVQSLGEPLIFSILSNYLVKPDSMLLLHPIGFAAWFACLATSLNLLPIAQLDGGHVSYALFRKHAYHITWAFFILVIGLAAYGFFQSFVVGMQWLFYSAMLLVLRKIAGFRHPQTLDDDAPVGLARKIWGLIGLIVLILTFMPITIFS